MPLFGGREGTGISGHYKDDSVGDEKPEFGVVGEGRRGEIEQRYTDEDGEEKGKDRDSVCLLRFLTGDSYDG